MLLIFAKEHPSKLGSTKKEHRGQGPLLQESSQQELRDAVGGVAAFGDGGDHEVGTAHGVAAGEELRIRGLVREAFAAVGRDATGHDASVRAAFHALRGQPLRNRRRKAEGAGAWRPRASGSPSLVSTTRTPTI